MPKDRKTDSFENDIDASPGELTMIVLAVMAAIAVTLGAIAAQVF